MNYLFIIDNNHNYVYLKKEFKGLNFPRLEGEGNIIDIIRNRMQLILNANECDYSILDKVIKPGCVFYRVELKVARQAAVISHGWFNVEDCKKNKLNTCVLSYLHQLRIHSSVVGAGIIIYHDEINQITGTFNRYFLLVQGILSMKWGFPKGYLEPCESAKNAAIRETEEETGITIHNIEMIHSILYKKVRLFKASVNMHNHPTQNIDKTEILDAKWVKKSDLFQYELTNVSKYVLFRRL